MFEKTLEKLGIEYKVIKPHTPKQRRKEYNNFPMRPLGWFSLTNL